jgi:hypothetical protein
MATTATITSQEYTAGSCTLRITGQRSPLSQIADQPVLARSRFSLQLSPIAAFDRADELASAEPLASSPPAERQAPLTIEGRTPELTLLTTTVSTYVQRRLGYGEATATAIPPGRQDHAITITPAGLTRHRLVLPVPPFTISNTAPLELTTLQLGDLAEVLQRADRQVRLLPDQALAARSLRPKLPVWIGSVAAVGIAAVLGSQMLTTAPPRVQTGTNRAEEELAQPPEMADSGEDSLAESASPPALAKPEAEFGTTTAEPNAAPPAPGDSPVTAQAPAATTPPPLPQPAPEPLSTSPTPQTASPPTPTLAPSASEGALRSAPSPASRGTPTPAESMYPVPAAADSAGGVENPEAGSPPPNAPTDDDTTPSSNSEWAADPSAPAPLPEEAASEVPPDEEDQLVGTAASPRAATPLAADMASPDWQQTLATSLQQRWQPPPALDVALIYDMTIGPGGRIQAITPRSAVAADYQHQVPLPNLGSTLEALPTQPETIIAVEFLPSGLVMVDGIPGNTTNPGPE